MSQVHQFALGQFLEETVIVKKLGIFYEGSFCSHDVKYFFVNFADHEGPIDGSNW